MAWTLSGYDGNDVAVSAEHSARLPAVVGLGAPAGAVPAGAAPAGMAPAGAARADGAVASGAGSGAAAAPSRPRRGKVAGPPRRPARRSETTRGTCDETRFLGLVAQIGHDLRTPLNAIIGFSDIMQRELLGPLGVERYQGYASHIRESGFALAKAVDDTLALTRLIAEAGSSDRLGPVDVAAALAQAATYVAPDLAERRLALRLPAPARLTARGDGQALEQALLNLLVAIVPAQPRGGEIVVTARRAKGQLVLTFAAGRSSSGAEAPADCAGVARVPLLVARSLVELQGGALRLDGPTTPGNAVVSLPTRRR